MSDEKHEELVVRRAKAHPPCDRHHLLEEQVLGLHRKLDRVLAAFPEDSHGVADVFGHRRYHEELMRSAEAQVKFWEELRADIARKGIWALMVLLVGLVVSGLAVKFGWHPHGT